MTYMKGEFNMLHPSYSELMDKLNSEAPNNNEIESRYSIVMAAASRARQIIESRSVDEKIAKQLKNDPTSSPELNQKRGLILKRKSQASLIVIIESL